MMRGYAFPTMALLTVWALLPLTGMASEDEESDEEGHRTNSIEFFVGGNHVAEEGDSSTELSVGITYERFIRQHYGIGGFVEYTDGVESWSWAVEAFWHPRERIRLGLAPGLEFEGAREEFLLRVGVAYEFQISEVSIAPEFNLDFVDGQTNEVFGVSFGWRF